MKKFVAVISILLLLFCHFSAFGEEIDLGPLSDEQLIQLYDNVRQEMFDRSVFVEEDFAYGDYVVGKDIRAGSYTLIFSNVNPYKGPNIHIYDSEDNGEMIFAQLIRSDSKVNISLEDGMLLCLRQGMADMRITNAKSSFAP